MREAAGDAAAPAASPKNARRGSFMMLPHGQRQVADVQSNGALVGTDYARFARTGKRQCRLLGNAFRCPRAHAAPITSLARGEDTDRRANPDCPLAGPSHAG